MNLKLLVQASLVFLLPLAVYHSALDYPFQFDDHLFLEDENVQLGRWIHFISPPVPRFLTWLTFLTQYQLHGLSSAPFHLFNLLVHALNGVLVFLSLHLLCVSRTRPGVALRSIEPDRPGEDQMPRESEARRYLFVPLLAALVFVVHPIQTEAILYVYQRSTLLATLFALLALISHLKGRPFFVLLFFALGVACKEFIIVLPLILWVGDGLLKREWRPRSWHLVYLAAIVVVGIPYWLSPGWEDTGSGIGILGTLVYAATQVEVVWQYVLLTLLPMGLNLDHHVLPRIDWLDPRWLAQLFMWAIMVWGFLRLKRHSAEAAFYVALFFLFLLPTSSLVPRLDLMFEHRLYASMFGFSAFLAWCFLSLLAYVEAHWTSSATRRMLSGGILLLVLGILVSYIGLGRERAKVWSDEEVLWRDTVIKSPRKYRPNFNLGVVMMRSAPNEAAAYLSQAIDIDPSNPRALKGLGEVYFGQREVGKAEANWKRALDLDPGDADTHTALGRLYLHRRDFFSSREHLRIAQRLEPSKWGPYFYLARLNLQFGFVKEAIAESEKGLNRHPQNAQLRFLLADSVSQNRNWSRAIELYLEGLETDPKNAMVYYRLARAYWEARKREAAFDAIQQGLRWSQSDGEMAVGNELLDRYRSQSMR